MRNLKKPPSVNAEDAMPPVDLFERRMIDLSQPIAQNRDDWGMAIESVARQYGLGFIPVQHEHYDFVVPKAKLQRPPVRRFRAFREALAGLGFTI